MEQPVELPLHGGIPESARGRAPVSIAADRPYIAQGRIPVDLVPSVVTPDSGGGDDSGRRYLPPLLLLLAGPAVLALVLLDTPTWLRAAPVLLYICAVPGYALVRLLRLPDVVMSALLGVGLSLALGLLVAQLMIYTHLWSPLLGLSTLVLLASLAAGMDFVPSAWPKRTTEGEP